MVSNFPQPLSLLNAQTTVRSELLVNTKGHGGMEAVSVLLEPAAPASREKYAHLSPIASSMASGW